MNIYFRWRSNINDNPSYIIDNLPRILIIKGFALYYKAPALKNNKYRRWCQKSGCKNLIKKNRENITKLNNYNKEISINYIEYNQHSSHIEK